MRRIRWHAGHNSCALDHGNGRERKYEDVLVCGQVCLDTFSNQFSSLYCCEWFENLLLYSEFLVSHVLCSSLTHDVVLVVGYLEHSVFTLWKNEAVGLVVHCYGT